MKSDIFICKLKGGGYWAYPSPFVAHGAGSKIRFRNLTGDTIQIDFKKAPVDKKTLSLAPNKARSVKLQGTDSAGIYDYLAEVNSSRATPTKAAKTLRTGRKVATKRKATKQRKPILVRGGSPPRIIVDV
jgi:hypothetical protein